MKVFLSHSSDDKPVIENIALWLRKKDFSVWLDKWEMTPGDSLINKIGNGIELSDKLIVFLSPSSIKSKWVEREVNNGLVMEIVEEKGLGEKFVIPALLIPCKIPFFLKDKIFANFTNKSFESACEELWYGIINKAPISESSTFVNNNIRYNLSSGRKYRHGLTIEFGVKISPMEGAEIFIDLGCNYMSDNSWLSKPNDFTRPAPIANGPAHNVILTKTPKTYNIRFTDQINSSKSCYLHFESDEVFELKVIEKLIQFK